MMFTNEGSVRIAVKRNSTHLLFSVENMNLGMATEKMKTIFDPLARCEKIGGRGLGLAVSKRLVESMGGSLYVESGDGSDFVFSLDFPLDQYRQRSALNHQPDLKN